MVGKIVAKTYTQHTRKIVGKLVTFVRDHHRRKEKRKKEIEREMAADGESERVCKREREMEEEQCVYECVVVSLIESIAKRTLDSDVEVILTRNAEYTCSCGCFLRLH